MPSSIIRAIILLGMGTTTALAASEDPLPSWKNSAARQGIVRFVADVTKENGPHHVPAAERIAVFDNDGTLCCEQPTYMQFQFGMDRAKALASQHPEWSDREPFKSAVAGDLGGLAATGVHGLVELTSATGAGTTPEEFTRIAADWFAVSRHPRFGRPYTECVYQPMLELLAYLRANGFTTYIVSGSEADFLRAFSEKIYRIPPAQVIGSTVETSLETRDGKPVLLRKSEVSFLNDRTNKPVAIQRTIGRRPIAAFGNSDGDLPMLQWVNAGEGARFCLYVHHTDADREAAYDRQSPVGRLDKGLEEAKDKGWSVVDMKRDWNRVFAFQKPGE